MLYNKFLKYCFISASWIPVYLTISHHVVFVANVQGKSMRPVLNPRDGIDSDWVLVWKFGKTNILNLNYGDIIIFKSPTTPKKVYCKRIQGMEYDTVKTRYPYPGNVCHIPKSHIWVEGDNAMQSVDSNKFGPISTGLVIGKVTNVIWPPSRWGSDLTSNGGRNGILLK